MFVYLDHNATTPVHPDVLNQLPHLANFWGNPSSIHKASREPKRILRETRKLLATTLKAHPLEFIFTSGASESNATSILSFENGSKNHFMVSAVEHPSVMKSFDVLRSRGAHVDIIPVDSEGVLDLDFIRKNISHNTALVSVMLVNNETGVIHPIEEVSKIVHEYGAYLHSDCVQALGKTPVDLNLLGVDMASFSAHKFYSLRGAGILYHRRGVPFRSLIPGGGQERNRRAGTENVLAVSAFQIMLEKLCLLESENKRLSKLRDFMETEIISSIGGVKIIGKNQNRISNTSCLFLEDVDGEILLMNLDLHNICVSTGAACSSGAQEPSPVLRAMGYTRDQAQSSLRISLGWLNDESQIIYFLDTLKRVVQRVRNIKYQEVSDAKK